MDLPGKRARPLTLTAEVLDTWAMTVKPVPGRFTLRQKGGYRLAADPPASIPLPGSPYLAVRLRAAVAPGAEHSLNELATGRGESTP